MRSSRLAILAIGLLASCASPAPALAASTAAPVVQPLVNDTSVVAAPAVSIDSVLVVTHAEALADGLVVSLRGEAVLRADTVATSIDSLPVALRGYLVERSRFSHAPPNESRVALFARYRGSGADSDTTRTTTARVILNRRST